MILKDMKHCRSSQARHHIWGSAKGEYISQKNLQNMLYYYKCMYGWLESNIFPTRWCNSEFYRKDRLQTWMHMFNFEKSQKQQPSFPSFLSGGCVGLFSQTAFSDHLFSPVKSLLSCNSTSERATKNVLRIQVEGVEYCSGLFEYMKVTSIFMYRTAIWANYYVFNGEMGGLI